MMRLWLALPFVLAAPAFAEDLTRCDELGSLKSVNADVPMSIRFVNETGLYRVVTWLDYEGDVVVYNTLEAGQAYTQETFAGHPWMITNGPGDCTVIHVADPEISEIVLTPDLPAAE